MKLPGNETEISGKQRMQVPSKMCTGVSVEFVKYFMCLVENVLNGEKERERMTTTNLRDDQVSHEINPWPSTTLNRKPP